MLADPGIRLSVLQTAAWFEALVASQTGRYSNRRRPGSASLLAALLACRSELGQLPEMLKDTTTSTIP